MITTQERSVFMYQYPYPQYNTYYYREDPKKALRRSLRKDSNRLSFGVLAVSFLMVILFSALILVLRIFGYPFTGGELTAGLDEEMYFLISCLYYLTAALLPFILILYVSNQDPNEAVAANKVNFSTFILSVFFASGVCLAANFPTNIITAVFESAGVDITLPDSHVPQTICGIVLYYIFIAVIPPFVEEFIFRGVILSRFMKYGNGFAVFASAILFALFHGNIMQFVFAFICGIALGFVAVKTRNIFVPILVHMINNAFSVTTELLYEYCYEDVANAVSSLLLLALLILGVMSAVILFLKNRDYFRANPLAVKSELSLGSRLWNFIFNPGFAGLFIYFAVMSIEFLLL